ncbi:MAG: Gfo/Idh/MocA family oxidoreductase [Rhodothermales bacterium]|nr:Gfo/Idh/MocA family oxidoreductase [Rhodothermales bacterium]
MAISIGIVGAGGMVDYHIEGFESAGAEIVGIADIAIERANKVAAERDIPHVFDDVSDLLEMKGLDAISIIVPNKFHAPLAIQGLNAGKHVFCEKPPALNAAEVVGMIEAAEASGKILMFNFNNRARPESYAIRNYIEDGTVGTINSAQAKWIRRVGIPGFGGWFTTRALSGGGPLIDLLHMLDLALYFMDYPEPAYVLGQTFDDFINDKNFKGPWGLPDVEGGTTDVEAAAHAFVTFKTGQVLTLQASWAEMVRGEEVSVVFQGTGAGGRVERAYAKDGDDDSATDTCELYVQENGISVNRSIIAQKDIEMGRNRSATNFIRTIEGKEEPLNTPAQALSLMKIIDAIYESARSGRPVAC